MRPPIPFRAVNRPGWPGYVRGLQRHHLIPRALENRACFTTLFAAIGGRELLHDFRRNGLLLPASEEGAIRMGLPLHRGPHRDYNAAVADRLGAIEATWAADRRTIPLFALSDAQAALPALQAELRRGLLHFVLHALPHAHLRVHQRALGRAEFRRQRDFRIRFLGGVDPQVEQRARAVQGLARRRTRHQLRGEQRMRAFERAHHQQVEFAFAAAVFELRLRQRLQALLVLATDAERRQAGQRPAFAPRRPNL